MSLNFAPQRAGGQEMTREAGLTPWITLGSLQVEACAQPGWVTPEQTLHHGAASRIW